MSLIFLWIVSWYFVTEIKIDTVKVLRGEDPVAALAMAKKGWLQPNHQHRAELGAEIVDILKGLNRDQELIAFATEYLETLPANSAHAASVMFELVNSITTLRVWDDHPKLFEQAEEVARLAPSAVLRSGVLSGLGTLRYRQADYKEAELLYRRAIDAMNGEMLPIMVLRYQQLAASLAQQGRFAVAFESMAKAQEVNDKLNLAVNLNLLKNMGGMLFNMGDFEQSIVYTQRAIDTGLAKGRVLASLYGNLGAAYMSHGDHDKAFEHFRHALDISVEAGIDNPDLLNNMGFLLIGQGRYQEALKLLNEALTILEERKSFEIIAVVNKNMGEAWMKLGDRMQAAECLERAYVLYSEYDLRPKRLELYPLMIENLESIGHIERALTLMHEFKTLNDETVSVESNERIAELVATLELERSKRLLALSENDRAVQTEALASLEREHEIDRTIRYGLMALVVALGVIALLLIRSVRFKTRAYRVLAEKNSEIAALNTELKRQSSEDALTGLHNRRFLTEFMAREAPKVVRAFKEGSEPRLLMIIADLDHFKRVNDRFGHPVGDEVLRVFANVLRNCARESDVLVRWGGEEFLWVCRDADVNDAAELCQRVQDQLRTTPILCAGESLSITCSLGFAQFPLDHGDPLDWTESLKMADEALYEAKRAGRNCWMGHGDSRAV